MKTTKIVCLTLIGVSLSLPLSAQNGQMSDNIRRSLFSDQRAFSVGDAVNILIVEETTADAQAGTSNSRETSLGGSLGLNTGSATNMDVGVGTSNDFSGSGSTSRQMVFRARFSATIVGQDSLGNFIVEGTRTTKINGEEQKITLRGTIRMSDISKDNTVYSYNISNLVLVYEGDGTVTEAQEPGLITKFLRMLF